MTGQDPHPDVVKIEDLLLRWTQAVAQGDLYVLEGLLSDNVVSIFTGSGHPAAGKDAVVEVWRRHLTLWDDVDISRRETLVRIHGDVAWATFLWDGAGSRDGVRYRVSGERWSVVTVWEQGRWMIAQTHSSLPFTTWDDLVESE